MKTLIIVAILLCSGLGWAGEWEELSKAEMVNKRLDKFEKTLDKIYTMVANLEIKFMGVERYNQVYDPTNEGEVAKQKRLFDTPRQSED